MVAFRNLAVVLSTALAANAQFGGLSSTCTGAAGSLLLGNLGSCLSLTSLVPIFTGSGSIISPLDSYLGGICTSSACSTDTITAANQTIQQNCQEDIASGSGIAPVLSTILEEYPLVREVACLQAAGNGTRCIIQTLYAIQNATGQDITVDYLTSFLGGNSSVSALADLDASVLCTDCTRAMYIIAEQNTQSSFASGSFGRAVSSKCGSSFASTSSFPADVSNTIGAATASATSGAASSAAATTSSGAAMRGVQASSVLTGSWALVAGLVGMGVVAGGMGVLA